MRFTDFYAAGPVCSPTRAAIQSGQYQARFGLTAHIPGHWRPFEKLAEPPCALELPLEVVTHRRAAQGGRLRHRLLRQVAPRRPRLRAERPGLSTQSWRSTATPSRRPGRSRQGDAAPAGCEYLAEPNAFSSSRRAPRPAVLRAGQPVRGPHPARHDAGSCRPKYEAKPKVAGYSCHPLYAGLLEELDACVGRVLDALDRPKLADDTLVIFTSDNGGLEREVGGWPGTLEPAAAQRERIALRGRHPRAELIVRWPGVARAGSGHRSAPAISTDFYPTVLEAAGLKPTRRPAGWTA